MFGSVARDHRHVDGALMMMHHHVDEHLVGGMGRVRRLGHRVFGAHRRRLVRGLGSFAAGAKEEQQR